MTTAPFPIGLHLGQWVVLHRDAEQGDQFVNGPFDSQQAAWAWAGTAADETAGNEHRDRIDADADMLWIWIDDENGDIENEWTVMPLIPVQP